MSRVRARASTRVRTSAFDRAKTEYHKRYKLLAPYVPELIAMKAGLRSAIQMTLPMEQSFKQKLGMLREFCIKVGFFLDHYEINSENKILISGKNLKDIDWEDKNLEYQMGELCAYPECCIEKFVTHKEWTHPLINNVRDLLTKSESFSFVMNPFLRTSPFHLYKHFPCGLDCEKSILFTKELLEVIKQENPGLHGDIVRFNQAPALFLDICGIGIMFLGEIKDGRLTYSNLYYDYDPSSIFQLSSVNHTSDKKLFSDVIEAGASADELILDDKRLTFQAAGRKVKSIASPKRLSWRVVDFR